MDKKSQKGQKSRQFKKIQNRTVRHRYLKRDGKVASQKFSELNLTKSRKIESKKSQISKQLRKEVRKLAKNTQHIAHPPTLKPGT